MAGRRRVPVGLRIGLVTIAVAMPSIVSSMAVGVVPPPQFNCVGSQATTFSNPMDVAIPDPPDPAAVAAPVTSTITVSGLTGTIYDVDVMTRLPHTAPVDLEITLTAPSGKIIDLSIGNGGTASNAFNGTTWDDGADPDGASTATTNDGLVTDHNYVPGVVASPLVPQEALAAFIGDNPTGSWTLTVTDRSPDDVGLLDEWSLSIATDASTSLAGSGGSGSPIVIPDNGSVSAPVQLRAIKRRVRSVSLFMTGFTYQGLGDLTMTLQSPSGTIVTLTSGNGDLVNLVGVRSWRIPSGTFSGVGVPDPISRIDFARPLRSTSFAPEESFGAFVGEDPNGTWILSATDSGLRAGGGSIDAFSIAATRAQCAGSATMTFTGPPPGVRIGTPITYEAAATSTGPGHAGSITLVVSVPYHVRVARAEPSIGGACNQIFAGTGAAYQCAWPESTAPGVVRTARLIGEVFVVSPVSARARMTVSGGVSNPLPAGQFPPLAFATTRPVTTLPSDIRAFTGARCTVLGSTGADYLRQRPSIGSRVYCGRGGNDRIYGTASADVIDGGTGNDVIKGFEASDRIDGGPGADIVYAGPGSDHVRGGVGADRLFGERGRDRLFGGPGRDHLFGGAGNDCGVPSAGDALIGIERFK